MSGGPAPTEMLLKLTELLEDGQWRSVADVVEEVGKVIPPGVAIRTAEVQRRNGGGGAQRARPVSDATLVTVGRRAKVRDMLAKARGLEFDPPGNRAASSKVRMAALPPRIAEWRRLQAEGKAVHTASVLDDLIASHDPEAMMVDWKQARLRAVLLQAVERLQS